MTVHVPVSSVTFPKDAITKKRTSSILAYLYSECKFRKDLFLQGEAKFTTKNIVLIEENGTIWCFTDSAVDIASVV